MLTCRARSVALVLILLLCVAPARPWTQATTRLTPDQQREFLLHADIVGGRQISEGITLPWRLTLSDGTLTHDAAYSTVDERKALMAEHADGFGQAPRLLVEVVSDARGLSPVAAPANPHAE